MEGGAESKIHNFAYTQTHTKYTHLSSILFSANTALLCVFNTRGDIKGHQKTNVPVCVSIGWQWQMAERQVWWWRDTPSNQTVKNTHTHKRESWKCVFYAENRKHLGLILLFVSLNHICSHYKYKKNISMRPRLDIWTEKGETVMVIYPYVNRKCSSWKLGRFIVWPLRLSRPWPVTPGKENGPSGLCHNIERREKNHHGNHNKQILAQTSYLRVVIINACGSATESVYLLLYSLCWLLSI